MWVRTHRCSARASPHTFPHADPHAMSHAVSHSTNTGTHLRQHVRASTLSYTCTRLHAHWHSHLHGTGTYTCTSNHEPTRSLSILMGGTPAASCRDVRDSPSCYMHAFYTQSRIFRNFSACLGHPEVGVLLSQRWAYGCVCSGCPSDHKCVQFVFKTPLHHHINIQSCYLMQQIISPAILGMFQTVAVPQSQLRCCAVGAVRAICELMGGDSSRFLSGSPDSPSCCMHAFYTQSRIFRNFSACLAFPKLVFCSAKDRLMGVCAVGAQALREIPIWS